MRDFYHSQALNVVFNLNSVLGLKEFRREKDRAWVNFNAISVSPDCKYSQSSLRESSVEKTMFFIKDIKRPPPQLRESDPKYNIDHLLKSGQCNKILNEVEILPFKKIQPLGLHSDKGELDKLCEKLFGYLDKILISRVTITCRII